MDKIQNIFKVVSNDRLSDRFYRLSIDAKSIVKKIRPGQFIHIKTTDGLEPFFRRPFSVYRAQKYIEILYEPIGIGTRALAAKKKGDMLDIVGPVGNQFSLPPAGTRQVVMIAGGIGIAPFLILSDILKRRERSKTVPYKMILLYGGRTDGHVYPMKEFRQNGVKVLVATDDGSHGVKGRVTKLFDNIDPDPQSTVVYTCGPNPMMAAVQDFIRREKLRTEAACEEVMACALGACLGCSIRTTRGYKTVCYDGPVFDLEEIIFE